MKNYSKQLIILAGIFVISACGKKFLDIKRDARLVVPTSVKDFLALMDLRTVMNNAPSTVSGVISAGEFYLTDGNLGPVSSVMAKNAYIWADDVYGNEEVADWNNAYHRILYANMALEVDKVVPKEHEKEDWNLAKGLALFHRGYNYFQLAQLFCKPYDAATAHADLGVPLRLDYDVTEKVGRGTVEMVYKQIIGDLEMAIELLPEQSLHTLRPNKSAACAVLARAYLQMQNFEQAGHYADLGLKYQSGLIDFNNLDFNKNYTFTNDYGISNKEVLFFWQMANSPIISPVRLNVDEELLSTYEEVDLRYSAYFNKNTENGMGFKGSYGGDRLMFTGLTTSELWLIRAECRARMGQGEKAIEDLNELLKHRYDKGKFIPLINVNDKATLKRVLLERRKEFYLRGIRWEDLRRLNKESDHASTLIREIDGNRYELEPGDPKWVFPIPQRELELSFYVQNER